MIGAAAIAAAGTIAGSVANKKTAEAQQAKSISQAEKTWYLNRNAQLYDNAQQQKWNEEMMDKQNAWNSPENQRRIYEDAGYKYNPNGQTIESAQAMGYNPNTATAQSGFDSGLAQQTANASGALAQAAVGGLANVYESILGYKEQIARTNNINEQSAQAAAQTDYIKNSVSYMFEQTQGMKLDNMIKRATSAEQIDSIKTNAGILAVTLGRCKTDAEWQATMVSELGPDYWQFLKRQASASAEKMNWDAQMAKLNLDLDKLYKGAERKKALDVLGMQYKQMVEELKGMKFFNSDDWFEIQKSYMNTCIDFTLGNIRQQNMTLTNEIDYDGKTYNTYQFGQNMQARLTALQGEKTFYEGANAATDAIVGAKTLNSRIQSINDQADILHQTKDAQISSINWDGNKFNQGMQLFNQTMMSVGIGTSSFLNYKYHKMDMQWRQKRKNSGRTFYDKNGVPTSSYQDYGY